MKTQTIEGKSYRLPDVQSDFERDMYVHLIKWKWRHIGKEAGHHVHKGQIIEYDAILPDECKQHEKMPHLYSSIQDYLDAHRCRNPFRIHPHFYHMASSQAANINLFLPILHHPQVNSILRLLKKDFKALAKDQLDHGYCLEYWGGNFDARSSGRGLLGDKSARAGTDSDIGIAYFNHQDELCLWLIEHKLLEHEFTKCGGYKSKGRVDKVRHDCTRSFSQILSEKSRCYYHDKCHYRYWEITEAHNRFFSNPETYGQCPFQGGLNQLWRNQLLALATEQQGSPFKHAEFSVVRHHDNEALDRSIDDYKKIIDNNPKFSVFTSAEIISAAELHADDDLSKLISWYSDLYRIEIKAT